MITIECTWCDAELAIASLDAPSIDCPDCRVIVEFVPDLQEIALAA